jgi:hypothetical protein
LKGAENIAALPPAASLWKWATSKFWVTNTDTDEKRQATATLRYVTDGSISGSSGVGFDEGEMRRLADTFSRNVSDQQNSSAASGPQVVRILHVLYVSGIGSGVAGYFSSATSAPAAFEFSNAREMFVLSADNVLWVKIYLRRDGAEFST